MASTDYTLSTCGGSVTVRRRGHQHTYTPDQLRALAIDDAGDPVWSEALRLLTMTGAKPREEEPPAQQLKLF